MNAPTTYSMAGISEIPAKIKRLLTKNNFVAGVVYDAGEEIIVSAVTGPYWAGDCWSIPKAEWCGIESVQESPSPINVGSSDNAIGEPIGYIPMRKDYVFRD